MDISKNKIIAFVHIPKAAGSTITHVLRSRFGVNHCRGYSKSEIYSLNDLKFDHKIYPRMKAISGHQLRPFIDFGDYENDLFWFVMLREPIERFISQYKWWCRMNNSKIDFEEWCEIKGEKFSNFQVKWLAGEANVGKAIDILDRKIDCAGSQAFFNESLEMLRTLSGNHNIPSEISTKVNSAKFQMKNISEELCYKYNQMDIELYNYFLNVKWERQKEKVPSKLSVDIFEDTLMERINRNINLVYHKGLYCNLKRIIY